MFFRYGYQTSPRISPLHATSLSPAREPTAAEISHRSHTRYALSDTETFSSNLVGEFRLGYTRSVIKLTPLSVGFDITSSACPRYLKAASADAIFPRYQYHRLHGHRSRPRVA